MEDSREDGKQNDIEMRKRERDMWKKEDRLYHGKASSRRNLREGEEKKDQNREKKEKKV